VSVWGDHTGHHQAMPPETPIPIPPAPWRSLVEAVVWFHRAVPRARATLPRALAARWSLSLNAAPLVTYHRGPVGPYHELLASPVLLRGAPGSGHVALIAVDSPASRAGGRRNWALPKELAAFDGAPGRPGRVEVEGEGWALTVTTRARPRRLPLLGVGRCTQVFPDGVARSFAVTMRGRLRLGSVEVAHRPGAPPPAWLRPGRHPAVLLEGVQVVGPPRAPRRA
jgi:hypothetical protein